MKLLALTPYHLGLVTKLDDEDWDNAIQWSWATMLSGRVTKKRRYVVRQVELEGRRTIILLHRWLTNADASLEVDHINRDTLDNQRHNLRIVTTAQNAANRSGASKSESGFFGVWLIRTTGKWGASIGFNNKMIYIGQYDTAVDAALAYDRKAIELRGPITHLNFPTSNI